MGAYEHDACACHGDIDGDGNIGFADMLHVLSDWGPCDPVCSGDIDDNGTVGFSDLLTILPAWGPCPCPGSGSEDDCADYDLGEDCECQDTLLNLIENGTNAEAENARCWLEHYLTCHGPGQNCNGPSGCPDDDPCDQH